MLPTPESSSCSADANYVVGGEKQEVGLNEFWEKFIYKVPPDIPSFSISLIIVIDI